MSFSKFSKTQNKFSKPTHLKFNPKIERVRWESEEGEENMGLQIGFKSTWPKPKYPTYLGENDHSKNIDPPPANPIADPTLLQR